MTYNTKKILTKHYGHGRAWSPRNKGGLGHTLQSVVRVGGGKQTHT